MASDPSNKAKIAQRVIEVMEFFDSDHPEATVMDIVRRFDRPQSSTSELLSSLVEVGLLYKNPHSRVYSPTPRAALLGCAAQPALVREGRLIALVDRLAAQTGLAVGIFGMVGLKVQIYSWQSAQRTVRSSRSFGFSGGQKEHLSDSAAGWLLLSTIQQPRRDSMLRRLNAEAADRRRFCFAAMTARLQHCCDTGAVHGPAGFDSAAEFTGVLFPDMPQGQPMAVGFVYEPSAQIEPTVLRHTLADAIARCAEPQTAQPMQPLANSAARTSRPVMAATSMVDRRIGQGDRAVA